MPTLTTTTPSTSPSFKKTKGNDGDDKDDLWIAEWDYVRIPATTKKEESPTLISTSDHSYSISEDSSSILFHLSAMTTATSQRKQGDYGDDDYRMLDVDNDNAADNHRKTDPTLLWKDDDDGTSSPHPSSYLMEDDFVMSLEDDEGLLPTSMMHHQHHLANTTAMMNNNKGPPDCITLSFLNGQTSTTPSSTDDDFFWQVSSSSSNNNNVHSSNNKTFQETLRKLTLSMQRSQQTRQSLEMVTEQVPKFYNRRTTIKDVLRDIQESSRNLMWNAE